MEKDLSLQVVMWGLGICATGFFFLAMWIRQIADERILSEIKEIKTALVGDIEKPGVLTVLHRHTTEIKEIKTRCKEIHPTVVSVIIFALILS